MDVYIRAEELRGHEADDKYGVLQVEMQHLSGPVKINLQFLMKTRLDWLYTYFWGLAHKKLMKRTSQQIQMLVQFAVQCSLCLKLKLIASFPLQ